MNKDNENRNIWLSVIIAAAIIIWLIMSTGCANSTDRKLEEQGHWPGWIFEPNAPLYGPHDHQIELINAYSDGWQDRGEAMKYE